MVLWDSMAIAEWLWERDPRCAVWPQDPSGAPSRAA
jgi:glutathione S-transferase